MRIIQVINDFGLDRGGAERLARGLHHDLLKDGIDAHMVALQSCDYGSLPNSHSLGFRSARDPRALPALARHLRALSHPRTLVHAHLFPTTALVSTLDRLRMLHAPCTMTEHNTWNRRRDRAAGRALDRMIYARFSRIAAISEQTQDALLSAHPQLSGRTQVITNGATLRFGAPIRRTVPQTPTIVSVARLAPAKNIGTAIDALAGLIDRPWQYVIAGDGPERNALERQVHEVGLTSRIRFAGHVQDVGPLLREADIFLMPSKWEGFGLAAVEAMNASLPIVASDVPGLREVVAPTGCPLVEPQDPASIAAALRRLLDDPSARKTMGMAGFKRAALYDRRRMKHGYVALWQDILAERRRR